MRKIVQLIDDPVRKRDVARRGVGPDLLNRLGAGNDHPHTRPGENPGESQLSGRARELRRELAEMLSQSEKSGQILGGKIFLMVSVIIGRRQMLRIVFPGIPRDGVEDDQGAGWDFRLGVRRGGGDRGAIGILRVTNNPRAATPTI